MAEKCLAFSTLVLLASLTSCVSPGRSKIISPGQSTDEISWTKDELAREISVRALRVTPETSHHLIRLKTSEKPHTHEFHDLTVFVLRGRAIMHLAGQEVIVNPGDLIEIPRGTIHWAENIQRDASEVYAIFNPPFDGKDRNFIE